MKDEACGALAQSATRCGPISAAIFRVAKAHKVLAGQLLAELDLYPGQEIVLMALEERGPMEQRDLVRRMGAHPSTVTKMVQRLESGGLVRRCKCASDARAMVVELTQHGEESIARLHGIWTELEELTVAGLTPAQRRDVARALGRLEHSLALRAGSPTGSTSTAAPRGPARPAP